jgi:hypothetical protein
VLEIRVRLTQHRFGLLALERDTRKMSDLLDETGLFAQIFP